MSHRPTSALASTLVRFTSGGVSTELNSERQAIVTGVGKVLERTYPNAECRWSTKRDGLQIEVYSTNNDIQHISKLVEQHLNALPSITSVNVNDFLPNTRVFSATVKAKANTSSLAETNRSDNTAEAAACLSAPPLEDLAAAKSVLLWKAVFILSLTGLVFALAT